MEIGVDACEYVCLTDIDNNGTCDDQEVYGCGYELAENYNPEVTRDDGSCIFPNPDDEGCGLVYDGSGDGAVGSSDLLGLLVEFGQSCED